MSTAGEESRAALVSSEGIEVAFSWEIVMSLWEYSDRLAQFCSSCFPLSVWLCVMSVHVQDGSSKIFQFSHSDWDEVSAM